MHWVPASLCKVISRGLSSGDIKCGQAYTGEVVHDGGPKLPCAYFLVMKDEDTRDLRVYIQVQSQ